MSVPQACIKDCVSGRRATALTCKALLVLLVTPISALNSEKGLDVSKFEAFAKVVANATVWKVSTENRGPHAEHVHARARDGARAKWLTDRCAQAVLSCLVDSEFHTRRRALRDICGLLVAPGHGPNCRSLVASSVPCVPLTAVCAGQCARVAAAPAGAADRCSASQRREPLQSNCGEGSGGAIITMCAWR
jgi:hypothetical protein